MRNAHPLWSPVLAATMILLYGPNPAGAENQPSFDCAKASSPLETAICASGDLSARDRALAASYAKAQTALSDEGRTALRAGQRQWLRLIRGMCIPSRTPKDADPQARESCLARHYDMRQKQMDTAVETHGGIVFRRVDRFEIHAPAKGAEPDADPGMLAVSFPQIESPATPALRHWNQIVATKFEKAASHGNAEEDLYTDYDISVVTPRLISLAIRNYAYPHGAAHGNTGLSHFHWWLDAGRELRADDLFDRAKDWRKTVNAFCFQELKGRDGTWVKSVNDLGTTPAEPTNWSFSATGLTIHFAPYEVASFADGPQEVVVPWRVLNGFLAQDPPGALPGNSGVK